MPQEIVGFLPSRWEAGIEFWAPAWAPAAAKLQLLQLFRE